MCCLRKTVQILSLKKKQEFKRVYSQGKYAADNLFVVYALANFGLIQNRLGITTSKKTGNAVARNRVKRWVKESYRKLPLSHDEGNTFDYVIVARVPAGQLKGKGAFSAVENSLKNLFKRLKKG